MTTKGAKILIADDEPSILMLVSVMLSDAGYEVIKAEDGQQAIDKAISERPDLIITDVIMPNKNGFEVCQVVRNTVEIAETPIIILSALGDKYNKITGFEEGADDYVTKPFSIEELKARVLALLMRSMGRITSEPIVASTDIASILPLKINMLVDQVSSGSTGLDKFMSGGLPKGSNVLIVGPMGSGKSHFSRKFIATGIPSCEKSMFIALDDAPTMIRKSLSAHLNQDITIYEQKNSLRFVDAYSWSAGAGAADMGERFSINGILELNQLSGVIADASAELGQTIQQKAGGRRAIDSISSLLVNFELASIQRFISQIARTALAFGGVTTLYVLEEGTVSEQVLNNIKYLMDGVIELKEENGRSHARVTHMKWIEYSKDWVVW